MKGSRVAQRVKTSLLGLQKRVERSFEGIATLPIISPQGKGGSRLRKSNYETDIHIACSIKFRDEYSGIERSFLDERKEKKKGKKKFREEYLGEIN